MFERLGPRKYAAPFLAILAIFCVSGLAMYPNLHATPKDVPFAIVSLDQGAETPAGALVQGDDGERDVLGGGVEVGVHRQPEDAEDRQDREERRGVLAGAQSFEHGFAFLWSVG